MIIQENILLTDGKCGRCLAIFEQNDKKILFCSMSKNYLFMIDIMNDKNKIINNYFHEGQLKCIKLQGIFLFIASNLSGFKVFKFKKDFSGLEVIKKSEKGKIFLGSAFHFIFDSDLNKPKVYFTKLVPKFCYLEYDMNKNKYVIYSKLLSKRSQKISSFIFKNYIFDGFSREMILSNLNTKKNIFHFKYLFQDFIFSYVFIFDYLVIAGFSGSFSFIKNPFDPLNKKIVRTLKIESYIFVMRVIKNQIFVGGKGSDLAVIDKCEFNELIATN